MMMAFQGNRIIHRRMVIGVYIGDIHFQHPSFPYIAFTVEYFRL